MSETILSIEAAIAGGSISLIRDGDEIGHWIGTGNVSRAEELLGDIDRLMREKDIGRADIGLVAVSAGPGSFTGIRIGIATALGLKNGLGVELASVSALEAMLIASGLTGRVTAVVPVGRGSVCMQEFDDARPICPPRVIPAQGVAGLTGRLIVHGALADVLQGRAEVFDAGSNLALAVGLLAAERKTVVEPLFLSK